MNYIDPGHRNPVSGCLLNVDAASGSLVPVLGRRGHIDPGRAVGGDRGDDTSLVNRRKLRMIGRPDHFLVRRIRGSDGCGQLHAHPLLQRHCPRINLHPGNLYGRSVRNLRSLNLKRSHLTFKRLNFLIIKHKVSDYIYIMTTRCQPLDCV